MKTLGKVTNKILVLFGVWILLGCANPSNDATVKQGTGGGNLGVPAGTITNNTGQQYGPSARLLGDPGDPVGFTQRLRDLYAEDGSAPFPGTANPQTGVTVAFTQLTYDQNGNVIVNVEPYPVMTFTVQTDLGGTHYLTLPCLGGQFLSNSVNLTYADSYSTVILTGTVLGQTMQGALFSKGVKLGDFVIQ